MTYPVTVYRWDDPGAPQMVNTGNSGPASAIKEVLLKCLVQGYGTKQPAGWSVVFDDANGLVLQNNVAGGGSGGMLRFWPGPGRDWNSPLFGGSSNSAYFQSAKTFTASNAPFKPGYPAIVATPHNPAAGSADVRAWVIVATAIGFYLIMHAYHPTSTSSNYMMGGLGYSIYCGDIYSTIPGDDYKFVTINRGWQGAVDSIFTSGAVGTTYSLNEAQNSMVEGVAAGSIFYDGDGGSNTRIYTAAAATGFGVVTTNGYTTTAQFDLIAIYPVLMINSTLNSSSPNNDIQSNKLPKIRGSVPGLFTCPIGSGGPFTKWPHVRNIDGQDHIQLARSGNTMSLTWINLVEW